MMPRLPRFALASTVMAVVLAAAVVGPWLAPHSPTGTSFGDSLLPPAWLDGGSWSYPLGTDTLGRDILSRVLAGARYSVLLSLGGVATAAALGLVIGSIAGYLGGAADAFLMRFVDMAFAIPAILFALMLASLFGRNLLLVFVVVALQLWGQCARQVRGDVLVLREAQFVALAKVGGRTGIGILRRHLLPHLRDTVLLLASVQLGWAILFQSSLSFLGVGVPPPTPEWGLMVAQGRDVFTNGWWTWLFPGLAILVTVVAANTFADQIRDRMDPRLHQGVH